MKEEKRHPLDGAEQMIFEFMKYLQRDTTGEAYKIWEAVDKAASRETKCPSS